MFCSKCGSSLNANGTCPVCSTPVCDPINPQIIFEQPPAPSNPGKGLGIAAMILGIVSLVLSTVCICTCSYFAPIMGGFVGLIGLILAIMGKSKSKAAGCSNGMATTGLILSLVSLLIVIVFVVVVVACMIMGIGLSAMESAGSSYYY